MYANRDNGCQSIFPTFLAAIESHFYSHGYAYRFGGDEYAILIPNITERFGIEFLLGLQDKIASIDYSPFEAKTTLSIGAFFVTPECYLTEQEILAVANEAKAQAKGEGKDRIVMATKNVATETTFETHSRENRRAGER